MNCLIAHKERAAPAARPVRWPRADLCDVVDSLRGRGYAIHLDVSCATIGDPVATGVVRFVESALSVAGHPSSGQGYVRISGTPTSLLVELTNLNFTAFDAFARDELALIALKVLRDSTDSRGDWLSVERGPRGQLRIATVVRGRAAMGGNGDGEV
jgi:hypothetical protein